MRAALVAVAVLLAAPALAQAPAPRPQAAVEGPSVTLGDLFENAGPRAAAVLGPAPAPGRSFVVESPQLASIARDYGLSWRPLAGDERVVVERPGRAMRREDALEPLQAELVRLGADPALDLDVPGFQPPVLPAAAGEPRVAVDGAIWDAQSRRFSATLLVVAEGMPTIRQRVAGRAVVARDAVVAARALRAGEIAGPDDLRIERIPTERLRGAHPERIELVAGQRLRRAVAEGQPIPAADLIVSPAVLKNAPLLLLHEAPGLMLTAQGRALEDGMPGVTIPVLNLATGGVVLAEVLAPQRARALGPAPAAAIPPAYRARQARTDAP
jgi:flagella basal body P-ring formation protein FlgA